MSNLDILNELGETVGCDPGDCASCAQNCQGSSGADHRTITLTMDDDTEVECAILTVFPAEDKQYIALLPLDENGQNQDGEVYLYEFSQSPAGDPMLANIENDEEYDKAAQVFNQIIEAAQAAEAAGLPLE